MNKKKIIQLIVVAACFGGSGLVLYFGYFKKNTPAVPVSYNSALGVESMAGQAVTGAATEKILPYGDSLDLNKVIKTNKFEYRVITYPVLDPNTEIGIQPNELIKPQQTYNPGASGS